MRERFIWDVERLVLGPAVRTLRKLHLILAERGAVRLVRVLLVRAAIADVRVRHDQRRLRRAFAGLAQRRVDGSRVHAIDALHLPAVRLEARRYVFGERHGRGSVERNEVGVVDADQLAELLVPRDRGRLVRDALHHVAVAREHVSAVVDDCMARAVVRGRKESFRDCKTDAVSEALSERAGGHFDPRQQAALRVTRGVAAPLPEALDLLHRRARIAGEVEHAVQQHRRMAGGAHEAVSVRPCRVSRVMLQEAVPQHIRDRRRAHRHARVAGVRLLHRID